MKGHRSAQLLGAASAQVPLVLSLLGSLSLFACGENNTQSKGKVQWTERSVQNSTAHEKASTETGDAALLPTPASGMRFAGAMPDGEASGARFVLHLGDDGRCLTLIQSKSPSLSPSMSPTAGPRRSEGHYAWSGDLLQLNPEDSSGLRFKKDGERLLWLHADGSLMRNAEGAVYALHQQKGIQPGQPTPRLSEDQPAPARPTGPSQPPAMEAQDSSAQPEKHLFHQKRAQGITAFALGHAPTWSLDFHPETGWTFETPDGVLGRLPAVPLQKGSDGVWFCGTGAHMDKAEEAAGVADPVWPKQWEIRFVPEPCEAPMGLASFPFSVELRFTPAGESSPLLYQGCGRFNLDPALHGYWVMVARDGEALDPASFPALTPSLQLDDTRDAVYGSDGCNRYNGRMRYSPEGLYVDPAMISTRRACQGNVYTLATDLAGRSWSWNLEGERLILEALPAESASAQMVDRMGRVLAFQRAVEAETEAD